MKNKKKYIAISAVLALCYILSLRYADKRLTYLEYTTVNETNDTWIALDTNGNALKQEFIMPYNIFDSISVQIGTFQRDNNSTWQFSLIDKTGKTVYSDKFHASCIEDGGYYRHKIDKKIRVKEGETYFFSITAIDVSDMSKLAFYVSGVKASDVSLTHNGKIVDNSLCFKVYGGNTDLWWHGFVTFLFLYLIFIVCRIYLDREESKNIKSDVVVQGLLLGAIIFILLCTFAVGGTSFTDENDNMRGGMVIANGGVLYRDYVTQHTPVVYYLCSIFAFLGAGSIEQFRLSYYILEAAIWVFLYFRHRSYFGEKKMMLLPLMEVICISSVVSPQGYQILSDGFQGLMFAGLLLEFIRYYEERRLDWDRCIIVSICIWGSFGAAFISAYALVFLVLIVLGLDICYLIKNKVKIEEIVSRYYRLSISILVPLIAAVVYFKANHALRLAFDQFYTFNREVYPKYTGGMGERIIQPFVTGVQNFFNIIAVNFNAIVTASATNVAILQLVLMVLAAGIVIRLFDKKKFIVALSLGLILIFSATRGYGFHGLAAWYVAILIIVMYGELLTEVFRKMGKPCLGIVAIVLASTYFVAVGNNLLYEQASISELESRVIEMTDEEEEKDIFLDAYCCDSLYFFYKDRKPVNPAVYMLPWYMDWYEKMNVDALLSRQPKVVVYNVDRTTWEIAHYTYVFDNVLSQNYIRLGEEGWKYSVWVKNE